MKSFAGHVVLWGAPQNGLDELGESLARLGFRVREVDSIEEARSAILSQGVDLVVTRLCECFQYPLELLSWLQHMASPPPVLVATEGVDVPLYLEAMRRGAFDCVGLPLDESELVRIITCALEARPENAVVGGVR